MSILFACRIFFLLIVSSTGMYPVSLSRIVVGMPLGRYRRVFITSLNMACSFLFSSLPMVQPSHAYVIIEMMMASTICHIACIFILLSSLLPVSEIMLAVAPLIFLSISVLWSDKLPLLFNISPRYSYAGTTSSSSSFSFRELSFSFFYYFPFCCSELYVVLVGNIQYFL